MVRAGTKVASADPAAVLAAAKELRQRSFGQATAKYRELGTMANLLAFNAISALPTRNFSAATFEGAQALSAEQVAELRQVARNSCASCSIGCEHLYKGAGGKQVRMEYENVFALGPLCGVERSGLRDRRQRALRRAGAGHDLDRRDDRVGDGVRGEGADRRAVAAVRRRARVAASDRGDRRARGARRPAGRGVAVRVADGRPGVRGVRRPRQGARAPGYEPRTLQAMALGLAVNARGADHNRSGAYEADLSGTPRPARAAVSAHVARRRSRPRIARRSWTR